MTNPTATTNPAVANPTVANPAAGTGPAAATSPAKRTPYEYALIQAMPRIERGELINVGVLLYSQRHDFLSARTHLDESRLRALDPRADVDGIRAALSAWDRTCAGGGAAEGMRLGERFRWLVAPRSTILRAGPVHMGLAAEPEAELERLVGLLVR